MHFDWNRYYDQSRCLAYLAVCRLHVASAPVAASQDLSLSGWELVWSDEFEGTKLDRTKVEARNNPAGAAVMKSGNAIRIGKENVRVADGMLHLMARKERYTGPDRPPEIADKPNPNRTQPFTSGKSADPWIWQAGNMARSNSAPNLPKGSGHMACGLDDAHR